MAISQNKKRGLIILLIIVFLIILTVLIQLAGVETVYTHLFYIPIILACIWWQRKGVIVAIAFGVALLGIHFIVRPESTLIYDLLRSGVFIFIAFFVSELSIKESHEKEQLKIKNVEVEKFSCDLGLKNKEIESINQKLTSKVDELEKFYKLTVGRELKMAELKKKIETLESPSRKKSAI